LDRRLHRRAGCAAARSLDDRPDRGLQLFLIDAAEAVRLGPGRHHDLAERVFKSPLLNACVQQRLDRQHCADGAIHVVDGRLEATVNCPHQAADGVRIPLDQRLRCHDAVRIEVETVIGETEPAYVPFRIELCLRKICVDRVVEAEDAVQASGGEHLLLQPISIPRRKP
jgi:hypothetical protein